jgi:membrane protease YdiL (CAAX protease family)
MTFAPKILDHVLLIIRIIGVVIFASMAWWLRNTGQSDIRRLAFTLMAVNLAFLVVSFFTTDLWGIDLQTVNGIAFAKLSDSVVISLVLILAFLLGGYKPGYIYLAKGRLVPGLILGLLGFGLMAFLAINNPEQPIEKGFLAENLHWILIFIFANGFMEELLFRGIFLKQLGQFMKPFWAVVLTSVVFSSVHLQVTYAPDVLLFAGITLILGLIWGFMMHYTKSIIAPMLFHAGADLMIILPIYSTFGIK